MGWNPAADYAVVPRGTAAAEVTIGWGWHDAMMFGGGFTWIGWLLLIALIAGVGWLVATLVASRARQGSSSTGTSAADIVKERYARGEIDRTEYEQKLQDLRR